MSAKTPTERIEEKLDRVAEGMGDLRAEVAQARGATEQQLRVHEAQISELFRLDRRRGEQINGVAESIGERMSGLVTQADCARHHDANTSDHKGFWGGLLSVRIGLATIFAAGATTVTVLGVIAAIWRMKGQ